MTQPLSAALDSTFLKNPKPSDYRRIRDMEVDLKALKLKLPILLRQFENGLARHKSDLMKTRPSLIEAQDD